jgi:hypothetical protein
MAATGLTGRYEHFMAKSSQVPFLEAFTHKTGVFRSKPVKASQTKMRGLTRVSTTINKWFPLQTAMLQTPKRDVPGRIASIYSFAPARWMV